MGVVHKREPERGKEMESLSFDQMMRVVQTSFDGLPDYRRGKNVHYAISDAAVGAFAVFFTQSPSFLAHQRDMQRQRGRNNGSSLFGLREIPTDNQIRNLLDPIAPSYLQKPFWGLFAALEAAGVLEAYRSLNDTYLCALDGTYYFSSQKIRCDHCTVRTHDEKEYYSHAAITPVLVAPGHRQVIALEPEFILPQDGAEKQDCEQQAAKRWVRRHAARFQPHQVTILADDLHSRQPFCEVLLEHQMHFILTCKPDSHPTLYEEVELLSRIQGLSAFTLRRWTRRYTEVWHGRYAHQLPLRDSLDSLRVNWCEVTIYREDTGERLYRNAFVTSHPLSDDTLMAVIIAGRTRWKIENENNNVLKNYGYHLEHNYGHGKQYLSAILVMLNLLAFLLHTILDLTDRHYPLIRQELGTRKTFFQDIQALTRYLYFDSWSALLSFMFQQLQLSLPPPD
jgi:hypothetical protein